MDASQGRKMIHWEEGLLIKGGSVAVRNSLLSRALSKGCSSAFAVVMVKASVPESLCQIAVLGHRTPTRTAVVVAAAK